MASNGATATSNLLSGGLSAPSGPTASPNVLAGDVVVDRNAGAPVAASVETHVLAAATTPVAASGVSLAARPNLKSLDTLFGSARAVPAARTESTAAHGVVALAAIAPAAVTQVASAPAPVAP